MTSGFPPEFSDFFENELTTYTLYENNATGTTSGSISTQAGIQILRDTFEGADIDISAIGGDGYPTNQTIIDSLGSIVTANFNPIDTPPDWVLDTPDSGGNGYSLIFRVRGTRKDLTTYLSDNPTYFFIDAQGVSQPDNENEVLVQSLNDLPQESGGIIQLQDNKTYRISGIVNLGNLTIRAGVSNTIYGVDKSNDGFQYTGTNGNAIEVFNQTLSVVNVILIGTGGSNCQLISVDIDSFLFSFQIRECILAGNCRAGTVDGCNIIAINNNIHSGTLSFGWITKGLINKCGFDSNYFENGSAANHLNLEEGSFNTVKIGNNDFTIDSPNTAIQVDVNVNINNDGAGTIVANTFTGDGVFISGISAETLDWIIENNGRRVLNTSQTLTQRKVRSEAELDLYLAEPDPTIFSYLIDATEFIITKPIQVSGSGVNGGFTFFGLGNNFTTLKTQTENIAMFEGGGNLFLNDMIITAEANGSSVFGMVSTTGFEAVEMVNVNFQFNKSLGFLDGFRQGLLINGFMLGDEEGLEFRGTWSGGMRIDASRLIFTPIVGSYMFRSAVGHSFASRFVTNANSTIGTDSIGLDFREDTFLNDAEFQVIDAQFDGGGTYINGITASSIKSLWRDNRGVDDTFQGCVYRNTTDTLTTINTVNVYEELEIVNSVIEDVWHESQSATNFHAQYKSSLPINVRVEIVLGLTSANNRVLEVDIRKYSADNTTFVSLETFKLTANGGASGTRVEPLTLPTFTRLEQDERIRIFIRNTTANNDITCEVGSKLIISKR